MIIRIIRCRNSPVGSTLLLNDIPLLYGFESSQGQNIYMDKKSVRMYVVWLSPSGHGGFTGISRDMCWLSSTSGSPVHNTQP